MTTNHLEAQFSSPKEGSAMSLHLPSSANQPGTLPEEMIWNTTPPFTHVHYIMTLLSLVWMEELKRVIQQFGPKQKHCQVSRTEQPRARPMSVLQSQLGRPKGRCSREVRAISRHFSHTQVCRGDFSLGLVRSSARTPLSCGCMYLRRVSTIHDLRKATLSQNINGDTYKSYSRSQLLVYEFGTAIDKGTQCLSGCSRIGKQCEHHSWVKWQWRPISIAVNMYSTGWVHLGSF